MILPGQCFYKVLVPLNIELVPWGTNFNVFPRCRQYVLPSPGVYLDGILIRYYVKEFTMINNQDWTQFSFSVGRNFENCQVYELAPLSELTPGDGTSQNGVVCRKSICSAYLVPFSTLGSTVYTTGSWYFVLLILYLLAPYCHTF